MSRFTFIASDYELPEIDLSGIIKGTVKELREMNLNPRPESSFNFNNIRDDCEVIFIPDGIDTGGLQISRWTSEFEEILYKKIESSKINSSDFELFDERNCCFTIE